MYTTETAFTACMNDPLFGFLWMEDNEISPIRGKTHPFSCNTVHIVPGSFNPLHDGHRALMENAAADPSNVCMYELSIDRFDKGSIGVDALIGRLKQFKGEAPVLVTKHPLFMDKLGVLGAVNVHFHIGIDTALRIINCHTTVGAQGLRAVFHVYPRTMNKKLWDLEDLPGEIPLNFHRAGHGQGHLYDISSGKIRAEMGITEIGLHNST